MFPVLKNEAWLNVLIDILKAYDLRLLIVSVANLKNETIEVSRQTANWWVTITKSYDVWIIILTTVTVVSSILHFRGLD